MSLHQRRRLRAWFEANYGAYGWMPRRERLVWRLWMDAEWDCCWRGPPDGVGSPQID
jgi:hypothetical protein